MLQLQDFGASFTHCGDYIQEFFLGTQGDSSVLYVTRMEPDGMVTLKVFFQ